MSAYWNCASFKLISFFFLTFSLLGCGASINNGQTINDLSGSAGSSKTYDVKIPENITGLLIEAKGSDSISLDLQDENENSLGACSAATRCYLTNPSAATYKLKLNASAAYSNVSLAGSWGGSEAAILINNQEITELTGDADSLLLKSIYVGLNNGTVSFTSTNLNGAVLEVTDQYGEIIETCTDSQSCSVANLSEGLFFARILGANDFTDATLLASWGNPIDTTLTNGEMKAVSGNYGDVSVESLYLQPGATAIMAHSNSSNVELQILNEDGIEIGSCASESCHANGLESGLYFVRTRINADNTNSSIIAAWAGVGESTMDNGDYVTGFTLNIQESLLQSFYVDATNTDVLLIPSEGATDVIIYNETGDIEATCGMNVPCHFRTESPGIYFVRVYNYLPEIINFGLSVAWANTSTATLYNGDKTSGLTLQSSDSLVQSFYVNEANSFVQVIPSNISFDLMIYSADGEFVSNCRSYNPCAFIAPAAASYFAVMRNYFHEPLSFSISVAWATENEATLNNGSKSETLSLRRGEAWAQSFYVDSDNSDVLIIPSDTGGEILIYESSGELLAGCYGLEPCRIEAPTAGAYFAAVINQREDLINMSMSVAWASTNGGTLANGGRTLSANLSSGETWLQSFYVDDNDTRVLLMPSNSPAEILIYDSAGEILTYCAGLDPCHFQAPSADAYFAAAINQAQETMNVSMSVAWASANSSTLSNGDNTLSTSLSNGETWLQSFYVDNNDAHVLVMPSNSPVEILIFDSAGEILTYCVGLDPCHFQAPSADAYFAAAINQAQATFDVSMSVAWANANGGTLSNGSQSLVKNLGGGETWLQSFYVDDNDAHVLVMPSDSPVEILIYDSAGEILTYCVGLDPCHFQAPSADTYFSAAINQTQEPTNISVSLAWGTATTTTIQNGVAITDLNGEQGETFVHSMYLDQTTSITLNSSQLNALEIRGTNGDYINVCNTNCVIADLPMGNYFITSILNSATSGASFEVSW